MKAHFEMLSGYNAWANSRIFDAVAVLSDHEYRKDLAASFGSLHRILNHVYVSDTIWMARFRGQESPPWANDHVPHHRFSDLKARRTALDRDILGFVLALEDDTLSTDINYFTPQQSRHVSLPVAPALAQFFNHQTHHRGECHAMLTRLTGDAPRLDLDDFQRGV